MKDKIYIFDTTLRDGEQASGFHMFPEEKLTIARQLSDLGVDIIEAGFAASSKNDAYAIDKISKDIATKDGPVICSLSRAVQEDITAAAKALEHAHKKRIHIFIATSESHIKGKFKKDKAWVKDKATTAISYAKRYFDDIEISCEDFGRSDNEYTIDMVCSCIQSGVTTVNLPDTVGFLLASECYEKFRCIIKGVRKKGYDPIFSTHNHDDMGMATAGSIEAIRAGARQVECTINGIGERAGNTSLEEIVAILKEKDVCNTYCTIDTKKIAKTSNIVSQITGIHPQPNKAIVGKNAFTHEAGIHQDGMIKNRNTYEIMDPQDYGMKSVMTFGARSGRNALKARYNYLNIHLEEDKFEQCSERFFDIADNKKDIDDADILMSVHNKDIPEHYRLKGYSFDNGYNINIKHDNHNISVTSKDKSLNCAFDAINRSISREYRLKSLKVYSDQDISQATATMTYKGYTVKAKATSKDTTFSAIKAYITGLNRLEYIRSLT